LNSEICSSVWTGSSTVRNQKNRNGQNKKTVGPCEWWAAPLKHIRVDQPFFNLRDLYKLVYFSFCCLVELVLTFLWSDCGGAGWIRQWSAEEPMVLYMRSKRFLPSFAPLHHPRPTTFWLSASPRPVLQICMATSPSPPTKLCIIGLAPIHIGFQRDRTLHPFALIGKWGSMYIFTNKHSGPSTSCTGNPANPEKNVLLRFTAHGHVYKLTRTIGIMMMACIDGKNRPQQQMAKWACI
jgi:hypothetical protein